MDRPGWFLHWGGSLFGLYSLLLVEIQVPLVVRVFFLNGLSLLRRCGSFNGLRLAFLCICCEALLFDNFLRKLDLLSKLELITYNVLNFHWFLLEITYLLDDGHGFFVFFLFVTTL